MTWHIIDDTPGHYHLVCSCGTRKWVRRWNIDTKKTLQCQRCHLAKARKSKLTDEQRVEIRSSDEHAKVLAERYGVSASLIYRVRRA